MKNVCISSFLCKMRLCCLISLKISGSKGLNVVTYGIISDSFFVLDFLIKLLYLVALPFQLRLQLVVKDIFACFSSFFFKFI